jgi:cytochrome bd-type quinol oxidase subunit 2
MFSGFYLALLLVLFFLIVRVLSFEWRSKSESSRWRAIWMWANAGGSTGIALVFGIALSNLLHGVPLDSDGGYTGPSGICSAVTRSGRDRLRALFRVPRRELPDPSHDR